MSAPLRPNLIWVVADDLGYADLGCYGGRDEPWGAVSPHLDDLAAKGLRFTQGYSNAPVCSPTRFALMTGRYQYRLRGALEEPINSRSKGSATLGLPPSEATLPGLLREQGYHTALIGKWHLGYPPHFGPLLSGYDEFFGPMSGGVDYFTHCSNSGAHDLYANAADGTLATVQVQGYLTDLLSQRAAQHVQARSASSQPFFLSLHYTAPHWPWETRDDADMAPGLAANLFHLHGGNIHTYRRMIHHMDEGIGQLVAALRAAGTLDNTLIVFTSDNGGERFSDNWPLVGGKMDLTEGGIRVPWIAHWPAQIAPGGTSQQLCMTMDFTATLLHAAGLEPDAGYAEDLGLYRNLDGCSLLSNLQQPTRVSPRPLHWRMNHRGQRAHRDGSYKYLRVDGHDYLFNLAADERERANLAAHEPDRLAAMREAWTAWNATMPPIPADATVSLGYGAQDMPQR